MIIPSIKDIYIADSDYGNLDLPTKCITSETRNNTRKIKNIILAISTAATTIPVKPKTAAIKAIIKNVTTQLNIVRPSSLCITP
jgi:hypothetical protein